MKKNLLPIIAGVVSLALAVISYLVLPETVVTQFSIGDTGVTMMPKFAAVALPALLGIGGAVTAIVAKEGGKKRPLIVSAVGVVIFIIMLAVNL